MVFRRIYWVVEELHGQKSTVKGVFTSIVDLVDTYLERVSDERPDGLRLTLVKLDSCEGILGVWNSPNFEGLREALNEYIATGEFAIDDCDHMSTKLISTFAR